MISIFVEKKNINGKIIEITNKKDINHLKNSFRLKISDIVRVVDGEKEYITHIIEVDKKYILLEIDEINENPEKSDVSIEIAMGIIKNDKMDLTIQKLTEIGIDKIIPTVLERTVVKIKEKKEKWDIIAKEALKQCQGVKLPIIEEPVKLKNIKFDMYDLIIIPYEADKEHKILNVLEKYKGKNIQNILYIIGSEGGFSTNEIKYLKELNNSEIATLGKRILRAETAAIVAGGILVNEFK
ncbi:16S rRNA (uracil1498-N3)-methyltransferase [Hypnocyclicus thermotrophus]|uniref:Ribosomal RNA small subunit methyltransferase E n=1 Tax=Hypnocyclicus thermotrophus TaxID=1627895 RepID=A0AA46DYC7_9FUSO|nr:16S rRNA (uracil(1498)-N(3))-methyltransferase [Hypnocyclicus thermotrophus]TDT69769.1 16S rRNA (uracil1498-N3)-methyltransferase [Hypnocyclicus thermotrophus]